MVRAWQLDAEARTAEIECPTGTPRTRIFFRCWHRTAVEFMKDARSRARLCVVLLEFSIDFRANHAAFPRVPHLEFLKSELSCPRYEVRSARSACASPRSQHQFASTHAFPSSVEPHFTLIVFVSLFTIVCTLGKLWGRHFCFWRDAAHELKSTKSTSKHLRPAK